MELTSAVEARDAAVSVTMAAMAVAALTGVAVTVAVEAMKVATTTEAAIMPMATAEATM